MTSLFVLIPIAMVMLGVAIAAFLWAVDHDQFEDLDREGENILFEDLARRDSGTPRSDPPDEEPRT